MILRIQNRVVIQGNREDFCPVLLKLVMHSLVDLCKFRNRYGLLTCFLLLLLDGLVHLMPDDFPGLLINLEVFWRVETFRQLVFKTFVRQPTLFKLCFPMQLQSLGLFDTRQLFVITHPLEDLQGCYVVLSQVLWRGASSWVARDIVLSCYLLQFSFEVLFNAQLRLL